MAGFPNLRGVGESQGRLEHMRLGVMRHERVANDLDERLENSVVFLLGKVQRRYLCVHRLVVQLVVSGYLSPCSKVRGRRDASSLTEYFMKCLRSPDSNIQNRYVWLGHCTVQREDGGILRIDMPAAPSRAINRTGPPVSLLLADNSPLLQRRFLHAFWFEFPVLPVASAFRQAVWHAVTAPT